MTSGQMGSYPTSYNVAYPEEGLSRISTLFRIILAIPALLVSTILAGTTTLPLVLLILFRRKYPRWWFDFNLERARYAARVNVYLSLMTDRYPSTDEAQSVTLDFEYPDADGTEPLLAIDQVVVGNTALRGPLRTLDHFVAFHDHRLAGNHLHWEIPARAV